MTMRRLVLAAAALAFLLSLGAAACDKGPMQRAGEGKNMDDAVKDLRK